MSVRTVARNREPKLLTNKSSLRRKNNVRNQPPQHSILHLILCPGKGLAGLFQRARAEVQQLNEALKSGDLASAQQDYKNLVTLGKNGLQRDNLFLRSDRGQDFNAIGGTLQNGDLKGAQRAFAALQSTFKTPPPTASGTDSSVNLIA